MSETETQIQDTSPDTTPVPKNTSDDMKSAPSDVLQDPVSPDTSSTGFPQPVDNASTSDLPYASTLPVLKVGAMGEGRVLLMQTLGLDVNRSFDASVEALILAKAPEYETSVGVTADVWEQLL